MLALLPACLVHWWRRPVVRGCRAVVLLLAVLWPLTTVAVHAAAPPLRDYRVVRWTTADGLPQNTINDIVVLPNGELWVATFGGLVRFDGTRFEVLDIASHATLASNRITALAPAGASALWYATQEGHLGQLEGGRIREMVRPAETMRPVINLAVTPSQVYALTEDGAIWASNGTQPWRLLREAPDVYPGPTMSLALTSPDEIWALLVHTIIPVSAKGPQTPRPLPTEAFAAASGGGYLWLGLPTGLARYRDGHVETVRVEPAVDFRIDAILHVNDKELWVAGDNVVSHLTAASDGSWQRMDLTVSLPAGIFMRSLTLDHQGSLWVGTSGRGLMRINRQSTQHFGAETGIEAVTAIVDDGARGAWLSSTNCAGVYHVGDDDVVRLVQRPSLDPVSSAPASGAVIGEPGGCPHGLAAAPGGDVWVRWQDGVYRVGHSPARVEKLAVTLPHDQGPIVPVDDHTLWVVSRSGDVRRVSHTRTLDTLTLPDPLTSATLAPDGTLWVGGTGEVFQIGPRGVAQRLSLKDGVPRGPVRDVLVDGDGTVWMATYGGGIGRWRAGRMTRLTTGEGLPDNSISRILDDGHGRLWLSTNRGVVVLARSDVEIAARGLRRTVSPVVFGPDRGVPEANFGMPAGFTGANGMLWFGTIDGFVRIDAGRFPFNSHAPTVRVDSILADDSPLDSTPLVRIPPGTARVRFQFSASGLLHPDRVRFRFRIEGIDADWVEVGNQRFVTFTPSAPGRHRFLLQARNENGVWNRVPLLMEFEVLPAWWQRRFTHVGGFSAITVLAFAFYRHRVSTIEQRHAERLRALEERRRSEEQAAALRAQLEHVSRVALAGELAASLAHEVNQPLTAIVSNAEAGQHMLRAGATPDPELGDVLHDIVAQGMRASEVIQGLREFLRTGHPVQCPVDVSKLVRDMLPLVRREFEESGVRLKLELSTALPCIEGSRVQLGQVVVNLLVNACEALAHYDGPRLVTVTTRAANGQVEIVVRDNGPGPSPDVAARLFEPFVTTKPAGMGMGLTICRSIAEAHQGLLTAIVPDDGGLRVTLSLPAMTDAATATH